VDDVVEEGAFEEVVLEQVVRGVEQARIVGGPQLERIARRERADRAAVEPPVGRGRQRRAPEPRGGSGDAGLDCGQQQPRPRSKRSALARSPAAPSRRAAERSPSTDQKSSQ
jgi:hypothetical protein